MKTEVIVFVQYVDDIDIRLLSLPHLRSYIGLVTQEPVLFDCSIRDNIAYGALFATTQGKGQDGDDLSTVPMPEIINAARAANVHDFVATLPQV